MTRRSIIFFILIVGSYLLLPTNTFAQPFGYEGVQVCGTCHKTKKQGQQLKIWQESKHANAYKTLLTEEANKLSGNVKAVDNPKCLKCHASGYDVDKKLVGAKFKVEDGVQCETCHGAGSSYKSPKVMKSKNDAVKNGLIVWKDKAEIEKDCKKCHNEESQTFKGFKFEEMWAKIAHPTPKG